MTSNFLLVNSLKFSWIIFFASNWFWVGSLIESIWRIKHSSKFLAAIPAGSSFWIFKSTFSMSEFLNSMFSAKAISSIIDSISLLKYPSLSNVPIIWFAIIFSPLSNLVILEKITSKI